MWFKNLKVRSKLLISFTLIILLAALTGTFIITGMINVNDSYTDAMDLTGMRIEHIFKVKDYFSKARMALRDVYYPENDVDDLARLSAELDKALDALTEELNSLHIIAAPAVQERIEIILPQVELYRSDSEGAIAILLAVDDFSYDNKDYHEALMEVEKKINDMNKSYADSMTDVIDGLPALAIKALENLADSNNDYADNIIFLAVGAFCLVAAFSFTIAIYISGLTSKPLIPLATFMNKAGTTGDITLRPEDVEVISKYAKTKDEIGRAISGAASFVSHAVTISKILETVADGDLTVDIVQLSDDDVMAKSIIHMVDSLSSMFSEIQSTTDQVSTGSRQVSDGAQSLAQGSTQQAASIEELSGAIADISQKTKDNVMTAEKTSELSNRIKESAEKGSRQMDEMIIAVKDINDASQSISQIIKTIDDIAFQTNILALNAAVEAARAGQHGKGFAVVAEEVRNLAAKSAEAAKETGDMIQNSMNKAEFGSTIADETAVSLTEIVTGINESSVFIDEIAKASEEQAHGISQINVGIDQVAQVVQQNSATAEESAAASEEMSSQAAALEQLLSLFKVKQTNMAPFADFPSQYSLGAPSSSNPDANRLP